RPGSWCHSRNRCARAAVGAPLPWAARIVEVPRRAAVPAGYPSRMERGGYHPDEEQSKARGGIPPVRAVLLYCFFCRTSRPPVTKLFLQPQPLDQCAKTRLLLRLRLAPAGQDVGEIADRARNRVMRIHFADHPPIIGRIAEQLRLEGYDRHRD